MAFGDFVQGKSVNSAGSSPTAITLDAISTEGNILVYVIGDDSGIDNSLTNVTDNGGNSWDRRVIPHGVSSMQVWFATNCHPCNTINFFWNTGNTTGASGALCEYIGDPKAVLDVIKSAGPTTSTTASSGASATTTADLELVIGGAVHAGTASNFSLGTGYTNLIQPTGVTGHQVAQESKTISTAAAQTATFPIALSREWLAIVMTFKIGTGGNAKPVRIANKFVGPMALRRKFRQPVVVSPDVPPADSPQTVTPDPASLILTTFAPTITVSDNKAVTPDKATLTIATFAPTVSVSNNQVVIPATAALAITRFAPTVSVSNNINITPATTPLVITTFAPTVFVGNSQNVTPGIVSLILTTFASVVTASGNVSVVPGTLALSLNTFAPSVIVDTVVTPDVATLVLTTFTPMVTASDNRVVAPLSATLTLTTFVPTVTIAPTHITGLVKVWDGNNFISIVPKVWNGVVYTSATAKTWDGNGWVETL